MKEQADDIARREAGKKLQSQGADKDKVREWVEWVLLIKVCQRG